MKMRCAAVLMLLVSLACGWASGAMVVAHYSFDDAANLGRDDSGNGYHLSAYNVMPSYGAGQVGGAADFDGIEDGATTPTGLLTASSFSLTMWARFDTVENTLLTRPFSNGSGYTINVAWTTNEYAFQTLNSAGASIARSRYFVPANQWQHLAMTFEALSGPDGLGNYTGTLRGYIDGALAVELENALYKPLASNKQCIGQRAGDYFDGMIDEYTLYSGVLTGTEIAAMAVPEPATLVLLALGSSLMAVRRGR